MTKTISAAANPALANNLIKDALAEKPVQKETEVITPLDTVVTLPCGYLTPEGDVITEAEVKELTGKDEEAISRATTTGKALLTTLNRGVVRIGNKKATEELLDQLLTGDRDFLLLAILRVTFGKTVSSSAFCNTCNEFKDATIDLDKDIKIKVMTDPIQERVFTIQGKSQEITAQLPNGKAQKELINNSDKTTSELNSILLENTVMKIGNSPVVSKLQVQSLGILDRRKLVDEINNRIAGPKFEDLKVNCPDCESEVQVPINLGNLFRF